MREYLFDIVMIVIIVLIVAFGVLSSLWLGKDNVVEETAEAIVEQMTGKKMDFSPGV